MQHAYPLAIIPLQSDSSSRSSSRSGSPDHVTMRALIPRRDNEARNTPVRSEHDAALMRSLISLLPHEQADTQFNVMSPAARSDAECPKSETWLRAPPDSSNSGDCGSGSGCNGAFCGRTSGGSAQSTPFASSSGLADSGLDFLGTTDSVRDLLHLPYTSDAVTVGIHRVGQTLVLDGNLGEVLVPATAPAPAAASAGSPTTSPSDDDGRGRTSTTPVGSRKDRVEKVGAEQEGRWVMVGRGGKPQRNEEWEEEDSEGNLTMQRCDRNQGRAMSTEAWEHSRAQRQSGADGGWSVHQGNWPALGSSSSDVSSGGVLSIVPSRPRGGPFGRRPPEPAGFWRSFQWELAGMRLMLGSSLQVCGTSEHPQVSVRLHDGDEELSLCTCLDYYLDNVMENVPELALCMREKGYIQGCRLVSTEDIPYLGSLSVKKGGRDAGTSTGATSSSSEVGGPIPLFDPVVVELNATILLRFLQENCSREGGTYLLHRSEGAAHVQLYDVSALSRQRNRRWKWLLAMLCYRFALRISHHIRQPWCRGRSAPGVQQVPSENASPGPQVVRQLQRRRRQLLENTLELLEELAQLGGGGHETICASVQEHIADTYLSYGTDSGGGGSNNIDGNSDERRQQTRREADGRCGATRVSGSAIASGAARTTRNAPWTVDSNGSVWTSPPPTRTTGSSSGEQGAKRKPRRRGGSRNGISDYCANGEAIADSSTSGSSIVFGASISETYQGIGSGRQAEEDLDKAQDHLASGIAILRGVMARQESAAAGRDGTMSDVVIVGESRLPVAVMKQLSPWRAVDDDDDDDDDRGNHGNRGNGQGTSLGRHATGAGRPSRNCGTRRGSFDESEDPATAMAVVSEQLWGLQQKLVCTYVAVARARLGRGFPTLLASSSSWSSSSCVSDRSRTSTVGGRTKTAGGSAACGTDDGPDDQSCVELAASALDALCSAWENLTEAVVTLDRRAAGILAWNERTERQGFEAHADAGKSIHSRLERVEGLNNYPGQSPEAIGCERSQEERANGLGALWAGSLSEALARSGGGTEDLDGSPAYSEEFYRGASEAVGGASARGTAGEMAIETETESKIGSVTWDHAARIQLATRRAELFELCGDVAHVCFRLHADLIVSRDRDVSPPDKDPLGGLLGRLEAMLASARPDVALADMDVCRDLHGHVMETLFGRAENDTRSSSNRGNYDQNTGAAASLAGDSKQGKSTGSMVFDVLSGAGPDSRPLSDTCLHALARQSHVPGDSTTWSLCLAAEVCYEQALVDLSVGWSSELAAEGGRYGPLERSSRGISATVMETRARLMRKTGDASNELGKLTAQCGGVLAQTPLKQAAGTASPHVVSSESAASNISQDASTDTAPHPGLGCAISVACAEAQFRRSLEHFKAIDDARNTALVLCNLASVERLKPRALARLQEACPTKGLEVRREANSRFDATGGSHGRSKRLLGPQVAIDLCGEAHEVLGNRDSDPRTWDYASAELAMAHLCLGVERRQELLAALDLSSSGDVQKGGSAENALPKLSAPSAPTGAQNRAVVEPLESALQIYSDMQNASQAAACHYQIGQYYAKVFPSYLPSSRDGGSSPASSRPSGDAGLSTLRGLKAWEVGQRALRHFLAARAYFGPFEHGPTSVILALDLCDLYISLANLGTEVPKASDGVRSVSGEETMQRGQVSPPMRPAAFVRCRCLEGALRSLLETQFVFADVVVETAIGNVSGVGTVTPTMAKVAHLTRLLARVAERVPRVMKSLVRASLDVETSLQVDAETAASARAAMSGEARVSAPRGERGGESSTTSVAGGHNRSRSAPTRVKGTKENDQQPKRSTVFKAMYKKCLVVASERAKRAQALLADLSADYSTISKGYDGEGASMLWAWDDGA